MPEEMPTQSPSYLMWVLLFFGVAAAALVFFAVKKLRESRIINSLKEYIGENIRNGYTLQQIKETLFRAGYKEKEIDKAIKSI